MPQVHLDTIPIWDAYKLDTECPLCALEDACEKQFLDIALGGAMMEPKLMLLDEPSMGLAPLLVEQIFDIIRELHAAGTTILLVEQNAQAALSVADRAYVLETGKISLTGTGAELMASDAVRKAYLGG